MNIRTLLLSAAAAINADTGTASGKTESTTTPATDGARPQGPTTPEQLRDVKLKQLLDQKPSFSTLLKLGLAKLTEFATECVDAHRKVKNAQETFKKTAKGVGKVLAAMKVAYAEAQDAGTLSRDTSFEDYHKKVTGEKPWNHALQCARTFAELVLTDRLTEADYDRRAADWLQTASVILGLVKEQGKDLDCDEVKQLVEILKDAADDEGAKQLRQLRAKMKGESSDSGNEGQPSLDLKNFDAILRRGIGMEFNGVPGIIHVMDVVVETVKTETREDVLKSLFVKMTVATEALPQEKLEAWMHEYVERTKAPELVKSDEPAAQKAA